MHYSFFPDELIELQKELKYHPELMDQLIKLNEKDLPTALGVVCTYCGVVIDGYFQGQQVIDLMHDLILILQSKRVAIITSTTYQ